MGRAEVSAPVLPATTDDQSADVMAEGCTEAQIIEASNDLPQYRVPAHQSMPRQETA